MVGTGYVGLVSGTCFAEMGNQVICVDSDAAKIERLTEGRLTIFEPGLSVFFERGLREKRLNFTTDLAWAVGASSVVFLALPTPPGADGGADLTHLLGVVDRLGPMLTGYTVIVNKSTVPVGTADRVQASLVGQGKRPGIDFDVVSNPEFLREGLAVKDFMKPERVVIGAGSDRARDMMTQLYEPFVRGGNPILTMDCRSAEMTKYAANAFLATKITFMNEVANLCQQVGADVDKIRRGIGSDSRIGREFLHAGIGFGGSCFPKDVQAFAHTATTHGTRLRILEAVLQANHHQRRVLVQMLSQHVGGDLRGKHVAIWGLAFKPNTDDVRESPAHHVIEELLERGATVAAFDPEALETSRRVLGDRISHVPDAYEVLTDADALLICTEWNEFRRPNLARVASLLKRPLILDGRNLFDPLKMAEFGFEYLSIGRPYHEPTSVDVPSFSQ
ncbi:MAG: UDP-glucose/GDP-mannose dehydrogenase family protein [bacterium]|nr:UDP-glucose/GDP-mannose dehydrogenase family protein [bacterium]